MNRKLLFLGIPVAVIAGFLVSVPLMIASVFSGAAACGLVGGPSVSVATWKVCASCGDWRERAALVADKILSQQPDVVSIQDGGTRAADRRRTFAVMRKAGYRTASSKEPYTGRYIFYRPSALKLSNGGAFALNGGHAMAWARFTDRDGNALVVVNPDLDGGTQADRAEVLEQGMERLQDVIDSGATIFAGDFGSPMTRAESGPGKTMTTADYVDARTVAQATDNGDVDSAHPRTSGAPITRKGRQDEHIYVPRSARVSTWSQVVDVDDSNVDRYAPRQLSDRNMLVADVQIATAGDPLEQTVNDRQLADGVTVEGFNTDQVDIARTIIEVGRRKNLSERAQVIAVMTGIGESSLTNVAHGDAARGDTIGVFQIGPEHGAYDDRMDPAWAAGNFYDRLVAVDGWENLEPTIAAHRAQRNADPNHYTKFWPQAQKLMSAITGSSGEMVAASTSDGCPAGDVDQASWTGTGADCDFGKWRTPRSCREALAEAQRIAKEQPCKSSLPGGTWRRWCLAFVARVYGYDAAGYHTALDMYRAMKSRGLVSTSKDIPVGALVFFTSSSSAGHVALYAGNGKAYSNDYVRSGCIDLTPMSTMGSNGRYLGWSPPAFPGA